MLSSIDTVFSQGSIETSDDNTDMAINGNGFFEGVEAVIDKDYAASLLARAPWSSARRRPGTSTAGKRKAATARDMGG